MTYAVHPFAVSLTALKKTLGSSDRAFLQRVTKKFQDEFQELDELDEDTVPMRQALEHLVTGARPDEDSGFKYGYALKFVCAVLGTALSNQAWSSMDWETFEGIDRALRTIGVKKQTFETQTLVTRGSPVPLPKIPDFPSIGFVRESEIAPVALALSTARIRELDEEIQQSVQQVRDWLDHCARGHLDLVCFYH